MNNRLLLLLIAAVVLAAYFAQKASYTISHHRGAETETETEAAQQPNIGGAFSLIDQNGAAFGEEDLRGHWSLVFFGFSHCPDMCPTALTNISAALDAMPAAQTARIEPVLITVDPARDTPEVLKAYAANFHPSLVALTGTKQAVEQAAAAFKVYYQKAAGSNEDYIVNHSGFVYVMNPEGHYTRHFAFDDSPEKMAETLTSLME